MRIFVAFRAFFAALFSGTRAKAIGEVLAGGRSEPKAETTEQPVQPKPVANRPKPPVRNDAVTLLAALQREARFVDIVKEPLSEYSDAQIGAAARDVLRDCGAVLDRMFSLHPIVEAEDGAEIDTPAKVDAARYRLTGNPSGEPPFRGVLGHHGWEASQCELPQWTGSEESARVIAPVEIEVKAS